MPHSVSAGSSIGAAIPELMRHAVATVFQTMARREVRLVSVRTPEQSAPDLQAIAVDPLVQLVVGTAGFVGQAKGLVHICLPETLAVQLACDILGLTTADFADGEFEVLKDVIGEVTNVTAGTFKNQLCDRGLECELTIPSVMHGPSIRIETVAPAARWVLNFLTGAHAFRVDVFCERLA